jgi:branched-chain amino acid transport system permease protein
MVDFSVVLSYLINGLMMGCMYALMALGLALILGVLKIVNFAHGEFYMWSAYISYAASHFLGFNPILSLITAMAFAFLLGVLVEKLLITPFYTGKAVENYDLLITFGLGIVLVNLAVSVFGPYQVSAPPLSSGYIQMGPLNVSSGRLLAALLAVILMTTLLLVIKNTTIGIALRATAQDREVSSAMGVNVNLISTLGFGIGGMLAGITGALLGSIFIVSPTMGELPSGKSFVIIVLGGMGSIKGTLIAAIMLGLLENIGVLFFSPSYRDAYGFIVLIIVLLIRPTGLFGGETL